MARQFIDGWEHGGIDAWDSVVGGVNVADAVSYNMDGDYCVYIGYNEYIAKNIDAASEYYFAFLYRPDNSIGSEGMFGTWSDAATLCYLRRDGTTNIIHACIGATATATVSGTTVLTLDTTFLIEVYVKIDDATGRIVVKVDGITDIDYTGDTKPGAETTINRARLGLQYGSGGDSAYAYFDNFVCDDADWIGETKIQGIAPTAAGNATNWTPSAGSNYDCVEEIPPSDTDYVSTNTADLIDTYTTGDLAGTIAEIKCVQVQARTAFDATPTPTNINLVARSGGTDYFSGDIAVPAAYKELSYLWEADPATAVAWIESGVNALQIGIKSKA